MVSFEFKRHGTRYRQIWFNNNSDFPLNIPKGIDVVEFRESYVYLPSLRAFNNGIISLESNTAEIYERFDKSFKYEVRRAEKEHINCQILSPSPHKLIQIHEDYVSFSRKKGIAAIDIEFLNLYRNKDCLLISVASSNEFELQYHIYFISTSEHILLASFPSRNVENMKKNIIGFANRYLHWFDIQHAHGQKKKIYNLGGIGNSSSSNVDGIIKFKMEMAPSTRTYYNGLVPLTLKGKCMLALKKILKRYV